MTTTLPDDLGFERQMRLSATSDWEKAYGFSTPEIFAPLETAILAAEQFDVGNKAEFLYDDGSGYRVVVVEPIVSAVIRVEGPNVNPEFVRREVASIFNHCKVTLDD
jgi:hypothetical protein